MSYLLSNCRAVVSYNNKSKHWVEESRPSDFPLFGWYRQDGSRRNANLNNLPVFFLAEQGNDFEFDPRGLGQETTDWASESASYQTFRDPEQFSSETSHSSPYPTSYRPAGLVSNSFLLPSARSSYQAIAVASYFLSNRFTFDSQKNTITAKAIDNIGRQLICRPFCLVLLPLCNNHWFALREN